MTYQATAHWGQSTYPQQGNVTASPQPTWQDYYNYAEQLRASGYSAEAEAYYRHAQQLYTQVEVPQKNHPTQAQPSYVYPSARSNRTTAEVPAVYAGSQSVSAYPQNIPAKHPKRSLKNRIKIWAMVSLLSGLLVSVGGFVGLFSVYKYHLRQTGAVTFSSDTISGQLQNATIAPMVNKLQPAFDKIIRLSHAAQPLLYELNLRDTPPSDWYGESAENAATDEVEKATTVLSPTVNNPSAPADTGSPMNKEAENSDVAPETTEPADVAKESDRQENEPSEDSISTSEITQESTPQNKSGRSNHHRRRGRDSNEIEEIEPSEPSAARNESPFNDAPSFETPVPPVSNSKTKELDTLLAPKPKTAFLENNSIDKSASTIKESLSRTEVQQGMSRVSPAVKRCGQGRRGTLSINVKIDRNGRISTAVAAGEYAGTPIGTCAERAVRQAIFPASNQSITVKYPFAL